MSSVKKYIAGGRFYRIYVPKNLPAGKNPLVLVYHGGGSDPVQVEWESKFNDVADTHKFIVVYTAGTNNRRFFSDRFLYWNDGRPTADGSPNNADDVKYTTQVLADIKIYKKIDVDKIYAAGYSNGGQMVCRLAQQLSDKIKSIASLCAWRSPNDIFPNPPRHISAMFVVGRNDPVTPLNGGKQSVEHFFSDVDPFNEVIEHWHNFNGCTVDKTEYIVDTKVVEASNGNIKVKSMISDGGHNWASGNCETPMLGPVSTDFFAAEEMWKFFSNTNS